MTIESIDAFHNILTKYTKSKNLKTDMLILESEKVVKYAFKLGFYFKELVATESFFNISDLSNSSIYSEQLINKFPNNPKGYVFIIRSKISINELKEAILFCERGLVKS